MLCITIAKLGGCREEKMITFPTSFRSSNYNYHTDDLASEVHDLLHNRVCKELGITKQELADMLGLSIKTILSWSDPSRISQSARVAMELMLKNKKYNDTFHKMKEVGEILVSITKDDKA